MNPAFWKGAAIFLLLGHVAANIEISFWGGVVVGAGLTVLALFIPARAAKTATPTEATA